MQNHASLSKNNVLSSNFPQNHVQSHTVLWFSVIQNNASAFFIITDHSPSKPHILCLLICNLLVCENMVQSLTESWFKIIQDHDSSSYVTMVNHDLASYKITFWPRRKSRFSCYAYNSTVYKIILQSLTKS